MKNRTAIHRTAAAILSAAIIIISFTAVFCFGAAALETPELTGVNAAYVYSIENKTALIEYNSKTAVYPTSAVKIMTAIIAFEALAGRMDETVKVEKYMLKNVTGNNLNLSDGELVTIEALFYALLLRGSNDAAAVLACLSCESEDDFIAKMNSKAQELGMSNTRYTNVSGMHDKNMYTTAEDTAKAAVEFSGYQSLLTMSTITKFVIPATNVFSQRTLYNRNDLISKYNETRYYNGSAKGINYGSTTEAGISLVTYAEKNGLSYVVVIMGGTTIDDRDMAYVSANTLINWALSGFAYREVLSPSRLVCEVKVTLSDKADTVMLVPKESITAYLPSDLDLEKDLTYVDTVNYLSFEAPVAQGQSAGYISVYYGEKLLGTVELITMSEVEKSEFLYVLAFIKEFTNSRFFRAFAVSVVAFSVVFVLLKSALRKRKQKKRSRYRF